MGNSINTYLKKGLLLICSLMSFFVLGQYKETKQIKTVFDQLVLAYGSAKAAPELVVVTKKSFAIPPANYDRKDKPTIAVDIAFYQLCRSFGKDSLNALALVVSHELTHYYNDHLFCSDYAYANLTTKNPMLVKTIRNVSLSSRKEKETEADIKGFFFATAAGYSPFGLESILIDKIYKAYDLPDVQAGYPSKKERKGIAQSAEKKASELYDYFKKGVVALENKQYDEAIAQFTKANDFIPYRENYNNLGVARTLKALTFKTINSEEIHHPERFLYPIEKENKSRLNKETTRSLDDSNEEMEHLLKDAQKDFQEAIRLDPNFTKGYVNLACVYDLLENSNAAIGTIKDLKPIEQQKSTDAQRILAIAYFHDKQENKANEIWSELKM